MRTPAFFAAAIFVLAAAATPTLSMPHPGADMLRASLTHSLRSMGIDGSDLESLSVPQLAKLRAIAGSDDSEGQKAFRARTLLEQGGG